MNIPENQQAGDPKTADDSKDSTTTALKSGAARCKRERRKLVDDWSINVDYLRGKPFDQESDSDRIYVNVDNPMARRKVAQIASQLPEARLLAKNPKVAPVLGAFAKRLNQEIRGAKVGATIFEAAKDSVNAAGFGFALCGYEARTESRIVPTADPATLSPDQAAGLEAANQLDPQQAAELFKAYGIATTTVEKVVSSRLYARRCSPSDFLWPLEFERSDFDEAPWLGHSGRMRKAEAKVALKLTDEELDKICGGERSGVDVNLRDSTDMQQSDTNDIVEYDEIFYWRALFDAETKHYDCIWRVVFVDGLDRIPVHGQWDGQKYIEGVGYVGATKLPIRVLTLDYVSDDAIPPSDSAVARPQVNEKMRSRTQMYQQRARSLPMRWHDVNKLDPLTSSNLMRGVIQGSIPVKGDGSRVLGEVARANYPNEDFEIDRITDRDINAQWGMDSNQQGQFATGRRTAREAEVVQANFATQTGFQRARVAAFFCGIAEVMAGLLTLHGEDLPHPPAEQGAQPMDTAQLSQQFDYYVLPDSTVLLDANQRADQLMSYLDMVGKSGYVNPEPIIAEISMLKGVDPSSVMIKPEAKKAEPPSISYRFTGGQDLTNPVVLAMLIHEDKAPSPEELKAAFKLLEAAGIPAVAIQETAGLPPVLAAPPPPASGAPGGQAPPPALPAPGGQPQPPADARPDWTSMPTVSKRGDE